MLSRKRVRAVRKRRSQGVEYSRQRKWQRRQLLRAQGGVCGLCGAQMSLTEGAPDFATIDHIVPLSKGGADKIENMQAACARCNAEKGDRYE